MSTVSLVPADALDPAALHAAFVTAFSDYLLGPFQVPLAQWPAFLGRQAVDLSLSRAAVAGGAIVAFCLAAPRADRASWRLGTMGALPAARGSGAAAHLLEDFLARGRSAGRDEVELECFAQNTRAMRLYERFGFAPVHDLYGYAGRPEGVADTASVRESAIEEAFQALDSWSRRDGALPLQVTPPSLRALPVALQAWRSGAAWLVASLTGEDKLAVHALLDGSADQQDARKLVVHLAGLHPARSLAVPQLQRDDLGGRALRALGLSPLPLHQRLMRLRLRKGDGS